MIRNMVKQTKKIEKLATTKEEEIANRKKMKKSKIRKKRLIVRIQKKKKKQRNRKETMELKTSIHMATLIYMHPTITSILKATI